MACPVLFLLLPLSFILSANFLVSLSFSRVCQFFTINHSRKNKRQTVGSFSRNQIACRTSVVVSQITRLPPPVNSAESRSSLGNFVQSGALPVVTGRKVVWEEGSRWGWRVLVDRLANKHVAPRPAAVCVTAVAQPATQPALCQTNLCQM